MAYTYQDFENAVNRAGLNGTFSDSDLRLAEAHPEYGLSLVSLRRDLNRAATNEQRLLATEAENQLRKNYGAMGSAPAQQGTAGAPTAAGTGDTAAGSFGGAGVDYRGMLDNAAEPRPNLRASATGTEGGSFAPNAATYRAPAWSTTANQANAGSGTTPNGGEKEDLSTPLRSAQDDTSGASQETAAAPGAETAAGGEAAAPKTEYQKLLEMEKQREDFNWDPETSELYSAYKKMYNREGDRAAANALAQSAAATGGRPSSWSQTAAMEANNYYASKLSDMVPELRAQALSEYNADLDRQQADAEMMAAYGDFSGYASLYGPEIAAEMFAAYAAQNPQLAYMTGKITVDQYNNLLQGLPLNEGLDESGVRIGGPLAVGGGGLKSPQQIMFEQYGDLIKPGADGTVDPARAELAAQALIHGSKM